MDKFDELELNGRKLLESFLIQVGATNLYPTEDKYAPVDYYFTYKDKKVVAEIKVRDIKYEGYDTHLMEVSKYKSLVKDEKDTGIRQRPERFGCAPGICKGQPAGLLPQRRRQGEDH